MRAQWRCFSSRCSSRRPGPSSSCSTEGWSMRNRHPQARRHGWVDSYQGLISTELVAVTGIFLLRQFFRTIPRDLEDAARLEGAGEWTIFWRVIVPPARPALATLAVLAFADQWRSFVWPLVATRSSEMQPLEVGIANLRGMYDLSWSDQMATAVAAVIPLMVLYFVAQKYFIRGIEQTVV